MPSLLLLCFALQTSAQPAAIQEGLAVSIAGASLADVRRDAVELAILEGSLTEPKAGDKTGDRTWFKVKADKDGWIEAENGYVEVSISSDRDRTVLIQPEGASFFYVSGEPRAGDVYEYGYLALPVRLRAGINPIYIRCGRGRVRVLVADATKPYELDVRDTTLPDQVTSDKGPKWGSLVVRNATEQTAKNLVIEARAPDGRTRRTGVMPILPYGAAKVPFEFDAPKGGDVDVRLWERGKLVDQSKVTIRLRKPTEPYKRTFMSQIDGSVQYYGVNPSTTPATNKTALELSLHGASVEAIGQAEAYSAKSWLTLVAATNRRPYGFDWEDWGRMDALEVLEHAKKQFPHDPARVYLGGHSMGGHGTWQLGALYPDLFAAISPSAGWISSYSYAGARKPMDPTPMEKLLLRANAVGDTLGYKTNYAAEGIYAIHGTADDNVPIAEARHMISEIKDFHHDYVLYEQPGAGHWWDVSKEPGADCVDWAPMYDFFERHALPAENTVRDIDFSTANPQVTSKLRWLGIEQQETEGAISRVQIHVDPHLRSYTATTVQVARFSIGLSPLYGSGEITFMIDGQTLKTTPDSKIGKLEFVKANGQWSLAPTVLLTQKNALRYGPLRQAFNHRMIFVYGTKGSSEENAWALSKARYDEETFWYRGNGSPLVIPDNDYDLKKYKDRNVILYGNADTNGAWPALLGSSPVQVRHGEISVGEKKMVGDDLICLFLRPIAGSNTALVAAVSGTGIPGMRDANNLPYLQPMIGFPDVLVTDRKALSDGLAGIRAAGFFGLDWAIGSDFVFSNAAH